MKSVAIRVVRRRPVYYTALLHGSLLLAAGCGNDSASRVREIPITTVESACKDGKDNDADGALDCDDKDCQSPGGECKAAPDVDRTVATTIAESAAYLYQGENPLQKDVDEKAIDRRRIAMLRGRVIGRDGAPLAGVRVTVKGHGEYGYTVTRGDGYYDMVVNGGARLTLNFERELYLSMQRSVMPGYQRYEVLPDAGMVERATNLSTVKSRSRDAQTLVGDESQASVGKHRPIAVIEPETQAEAVFENGDRSALDTLSVTVTEFPSTPEQEYLPGSATSVGGVSFGFDFAVKEAHELSARQVAFSKPVSLYVESPPTMPVGRALSVQYYDQALGQWELGATGQVIEVLETRDGVATLDVDGDGAEDSVESLEKQGIAESDRRELAARYRPGQRLFHAEVTHFSDWQIKAEGVAPQGAVVPVQRGLVMKTLDTPTRRAHMEIEPQVSMHSHAVYGSPFSLHYQSNRTVSYAAGRLLELPLLGDDCPAGLQGIRSRITIAGQVFEQTVKASELRNKPTHVVKWEGKDVNQRQFQSAQVAQVSIAYLYDDATAPGVTAVLPVNFEVKLGGWDARAYGLGGFSLDALHAYDPAQQILYLGSGEQRSAENVALTTKSACRDTSFDSGTPDSLFVTPDGSLLFTDDQQDSDAFGRVIRIDREGQAKVLFGKGASGAAANLKMTQPQGLAMLQDGRIIVADIYDKRIVELSPSGEVKVLVSAEASDKPVVVYPLTGPEGVALGTHEEIYFADDNAIYRYEAGVVTRFAGGGTATQEGAKASEAELVVPSGIAVGKDGSVYISERGAEGKTGGHRVRRVLSNGSIYTVAGTGTPGFSGDGGKATEAALREVTSIAIGPDESLYIVDQGNNRIRRVTPDGIIETVVGGGEQSFASGSLNGRLAALVNIDYPDGITIGPDNALYIATKHQVIRVDKGLAEIAETDSLVPSKDGKQLYRFDYRGRHLSTMDYLTGNTELKFAYDDQGLLSSITDKSGNLTKVERDSSGKKITFVAPFGQRTEVRFKDNGDAEAIVDPLGRTTELSWGEDNLVKVVKDPLKRETVYGYDVTGRLLDVTNPTGIMTTLKRTEVDKGWSVAVTERRSSESSEAGETTTYDTIGRSAARLQRNIKRYDGTVIARQELNESRTTRVPDGTEYYQSYNASTAFGAQVMTPYEARVTTPSGKTFESVTRELTLSKDIQNPLTLESWSSLSDINGRQGNAEYQRASRTFSQTTPMGRSSTVTLDELGRPLSAKAAGMPEMAWEYDAAGRVTRVRKTAGGQTRESRYDYNDYGFVSYFADALGEETRYTKDVVGRLTAWERPDKGTTKWEHDDANNVTALTPPARDAHRFSYDNKTQFLTLVTPPAVSPSGAGVTQFAYNSKHELTRIMHAGNESINFSYDPWHRLIKQDLKSASISFGYSPAGKLNHINRSDSVALDLSYDGPLLTASTWKGAVNGNVKATFNENLWLSTMTVNDASTVSFAYDDDGLVVSASSSAGTLSLTRDADRGWVTATSLGTVSTKQGYSAFAELSSLSATVSGAALFEQNIVERDALGRIRHLTETVQGASHDIRYEYDLAGRLAKQTRDGVTTEYAYDLNGNRTSVKVGLEPAITATYDAQDRILTYGTQLYTHSDHGDLKTRTDGSKSVELAYDELGNLMKATLSEGGKVVRRIEYLVDGLGRRVARRIDGQFDRAWFYRDALRPEGEIDSAGTFTHYVYTSHDEQSGAPDALIRAGVLYRVVKDQLGSVRLVVNASNGAVAQSIDYDAYGRVLNETGAGFQPFGFAGGLYDADTKLVRFGARDYDPGMGRFTNKDPIGFAGQQGNQYAYVNGDPVNLADPQGTVLPVAAMVIGGVIGAGFNAYDAYAADKGGWAIAGAALLGAGTGAASALGGGLISTLVLGGGMSALNKGGMNAILGQQHTVGGYFVAATAGVGGSLLGFGLASRAGTAIPEGLAGAHEFFEGSAGTFSEMITEEVSRLEAVSMYNELVRTDLAKWSCIGNVTGGSVGGMAGEFAP